MHSRVDGEYRGRVREAVVMAGSVFEHLRADPKRYGEPTAAGVLYAVSISMDVSPEDIKFVLRQVRGLCKALERQDAKFLVEEE